MGPAGTEKLVWVTTFADAVDIICAKDLDWTIFVDFKPFVKINVKEPNGFSSFENGGAKTQNRTELREDGKRIFLGKTPSNELKLGPHHKRQRLLDGYYHLLGRHNVLKQAISVVD